MFHQEQIVRLKIPYWPELSIEKIWVKALLVKDFLKYMPNDWTTSKKVQREFFYTILCTLAKDFVIKLIQECQEQRYENKMMSKLKNQGIRMTLDKNWANILTAHKFVPPGK